MIRIRQHGSKGELNDICTFLVDLDAFFDITVWSIRIDECLGDGHQFIEAEDGHELTALDFRTAYRNIYQTIDGLFMGYSENGLVVILEAVDSSYWEITSTPNFEQHMLTKYGQYVYNDA